MKHYFSFRRNDEDEYTRLYLIWGLRPVDISQCNLKSAEYCRGTHVTAEDFDMNTPEAQIAFKVKGRFQIYKVRKWAKIRNRYN